MTRRHIIYFLTTKLATSCSSFSGVNVTETNRLDIYFKTVVFTLKRRTRQKKSIQSIKFVECIFSY